MKISFEPNRLAERFLSEAYEKVNCIVKQSKNVDEKNKVALQSENFFEKIGGL